MNEPSTTTANTTGPQTEVRALMTRTVARIDPEARLDELALKLSAVSVGALAVGTMDAITGVVSERDFTRAYGQTTDPDQLRVADIASRGTLWCAPDSTAKSAAQLMCKHRVRHLLVGDGGDGLEGIVSARDLLEALVSD